MEKHKWYEANTGNYQGLIIEEKTGKTIAVSYDKSDTALIAAAPDLFEAAKALLDRIDNITTDEFSRGGEKKEREALREILE